MFPVSPLGSSITCQQLSGSDQLVSPELNSALSIRFRPLSVVGYGAEADVVVKVEDLVAVEAVEELLVVAEVILEVAEGVVVGDELLLLLDDAAPNVSEVEVEVD